MAKIEGTIGLFSKARQGGMNTTKNRMFISTELEGWVDPEDSPFQHHEFRFQHLEIHPV